MSFAKRFISEKELGRSASQLRLVPTPFQEKLLEFLERERIVVPAARIRWPRSLVIRERGGVPPSPPTEEEIVASQTLDTALERWRRYGADPEDAHPLDQNNSVWSSLVEIDIRERVFEPWQTFRTNIHATDEEPLFVDAAVDTFYHGWQVLQLADALDMSVHVLLDLQNRDILECALSGNLEKLATAPTFQLVSFLGKQVWRRSRGGRRSSTRSRRLR